MVLFTVIYEKQCEEIIIEMNKIKEYFKARNVVIGISESIVNNTHFIKFFCEDKDFNEKTRDRFHLYMANVLYKIVVLEFHRKEMIEVLTDTYFFLKGDEIRYISKKAMEVLQSEGSISDENMVYCINRRNAITKKIVTCLEENNEININGFITFRMKELREDLEEIMDKVVEKYMVEKEYDEFITLLKYFVQVQDSKIKEVHIEIKEDGSYLLQDKNKKDIMNQLFNEIKETRSSGIASMEDLLISALITNAPEKIVIHAADNCGHKEVINTIKNVFEDRVTFLQ